MRAAVMLRPGQTYRREAFEQGLRELGYRIEAKYRTDPQPGDLVVLWNISRPFEPVAHRYEARGARVVVAENGYLPIGGEKSFALALRRHNGAGEWFPGPEPRHETETAPWRTGGRRVVILAQRGIGPVGVAQPRSWLTYARDELQARQDLPVAIRRHPGLVSGSQPTLEQDLRDARFAVTWASGAGVKAICAGVPVFYDFAKWIGSPGARPFDHDLDDPYLGDRTEMLTRLSWAQWRLEEIQSGEAFAHLLDRS